MTTHETEKITKLNFSAGLEQKNLKLFAFYDKKSRNFMPPFFADCEEVAIRQASHIVNFTNSLICKFPQDYVLHFVGEFSEKEGIIYGDVCKEIIECSELKNDESIRYDELLKECKQQQDVIQSLISTVHDLSSKLDKRIQEDYNKPVDLYTPVSDVPVKKKSILNKLFN